MENSKVVDSVAVHSLLREKLIIRMTFRGDKYDLHGSSEEVQQEATYLQIEMS